MIELSAQHIQLLVYGIPMIVVWSAFWWFTKSRHNKYQSILSDSIESGLAEPASLHPIIDPELCFGCAACTMACPQGDILGLISGKAQLLEPANCIGHGACKSSCPYEAISLVFGTEKRGVDIPVLNSNFETNVPGIFIAGELGGMGLIRNAIEQGKQAVDGITKLLTAKHTANLDLVIVGAGPAGIAASLSAKKNNLKFVTIDQASFGGTVAQFPRHKIVMTAPVDLPLVGKISVKETSKEKLLELWAKIIADTKLRINFQERLLGIEWQDDKFLLTSSKTNYQTRSVLLCLGRRGTPRKLGVDGEQLAKVVYRLIDPEQYQNQKVLIVGGSDSALEAALSVSQANGTEVILAYRGEVISRAKPANRKKLAEAESSQKLTVLLNTTVDVIHNQTVQLRHNEQTRIIDNDAVIVCAGGILPTAFLNSIGVKVETKFGTC